MVQSAWGEPAPEPDPAAVHAPAETPLGIAQIEVIPVVSAEALAAMGAQIRDAVAAAVRAGFEDAATEPADGPSL